MNEDAIIQMLRELEIYGFRYTKDFYKDITNLIDTDLKKFIKVFSFEMKLFDENEYNKFERLYPEEENQKKKLGDDKLYRYEYRRSKKNVKCIFVLFKKDGTKLFLNAFQEDWDKTKGDNSYKDNMKRAMRILSKERGKII